MLAGKIPIRVLLTACRIQFRRNASSCSSTIFALSSGFNRSAVATIRISGPSSSEALVQMAGLRREKVKPRYAYLRQIHHPLNQELLDKGLVLWFPAPYSYTGEDSLEFQVHGGTAVISSILNALQCLPHYRMAEPGIILQQNLCTRLLNNYFSVCFYFLGEFTRRAFLAGKLDVTEVEGLADLLRAETEIQRKQAVRQARGELATLYATWRNRVIEAMAHLEAFIDFGEDQDIGSEVVDHVCKTVDELRSEIDKYLSDNRRGERLRIGVHVAIVGEPNVGKSSLLNLLSRKQAAIVSPYAGTTRDVLEMALDIGGYPLVLCDTAGLRITDDPVEKEGLERARERAAQADLVILVVDAVSVGEIASNYSGFLKRKLKNLGLEFREDVRYHLLVNKVDLLPSFGELDPEGQDVTFISCKTQQGLNRFLEQLTAHLASLCANPSSEAPCITHSRHRVHLTRCVNHLVNCRNYVQLDLALAGQELRNAVKCLGHISGRVHTEEILDVLFHSFCIGK